MSDLTEAADSIAADSEPAPPTQAEAQALAESGEAEGTTPEEVAQVLKGSGMKVDTPAPPAEVADEAEEGDDPDAVVAPAETEEAEPEPEPDTKPKPVPVADEATASDKYSFEVEDANGVTFKIAVGAKMEDILAEFEPKNNGQVIDILQQLSKLETQKTADEARAAEEVVDQQRRERASEMLSGWQDEAKALQGAKRLPDGADGDKRVSEVYKFMNQENDKRIAAGKPTLNSFEDALDKLENKEARDKVVADAKADKERARANGALVGGSSAAASGATSAYRAGSAKNVNQAIRVTGLL